MAISNLATGAFTAANSTPTSEKSSSFGDSQGSSSASRKPSSLSSQGTPSRSSSAKKLKHKVSKLAGSTPKGTPSKRSSMGSSSSSSARAHAAMLLESVGSSPGTPSRKVSQKKQARYLKEMAKQRQEAERMEAARQKLLDLAAAGKGKQAADSDEESDEDSDEDSDEEEEEEEEEQVVKPKRRTADKPREIQVKALKAVKRLPKKAQAVTITFCTSDGGQVSAQKSYNAMNTDFLGDVISNNLPKNWYRKDDVYRVNDVVVDITTQPRLMDCGLAKGGTVMIQSKGMAG